MLKVARFSILHLKNEEMKVWICQNILFAFFVQIGLLVFEAHSRWVKNQSLLSESMKQVSSLAGKSQDNYGAWAWDLVMKLHLHIYDRSNNGIRLATLLRVSFYMMLRSAATFINVTLHYLSLFMYFRICRHCRRSKVILNWKIFVWDYLRKIHWLVCCRY